MPRIEIQTRIKAPIKVMFDLSRSIDAHLAGQTRITETAGDWTQLRDVFDFTSPLGVLGRVMDHLILVRYMTRLLEERNATLKALAESGADMK